MITILDRQSRPGPPPWMDGARDLACIVGRDGMLWTCAEPGLVATDGWLDLPDGYAVGGRFESADLSALRRDAGPYQVVQVPDLRGWLWDAPVVCNDDGDRAFAVAYGDDWLPALTPEQDRVLAIAAEARQVFGNQIDNPVAEGFSMRAGCAWAATLLGLTYHLSPQVIARCRMMDDALAIGVIREAASLPPLKVQR